MGVRTGGFGRSSSRSSLRGGRCVRGADFRSRRIRRGCRARSVGAGTAVGISAMTTTTAVCTRGRSICAVTERRRGGVVGSGRFRPRPRLTIALGRSGRGTGTGPDTTRAAAIAGSGVRRAMSRWNGRGGRGRRRKWRSYGYFFKARAHTRRDRGLDLLPQPPASRRRQREPLTAVRTPGRQPGWAGRGNRRIRQRTSPRISGPRPPRTHRRRPRGDYRSRSVTSESCLPTMPARSAGSEDLLASISGCSCCLTQPASTSRQRDPEDLALWPSL